MGNFDHLLKVPEFQNFTVPAIKAEKIFAEDPDSAMINIRKATEEALQALYRLEGIPEPMASKGSRPSLADYLNHYQLLDILPSRLRAELNLIRKMGNIAAHSSKPMNPKEVVAAFQILFELLDWMAYSYSPANSDVYQEGRRFDASLLKRSSGSAGPASDAAAAELEKKKKELDEAYTRQQKELEEQKKALEEQNKALEALKKQLEEEKAQLKKPKQEYKFAPLEEETRKLFIDSMVENAGWTRGKDWLEELEVTGMPTLSHKGYVDYVLMDDDGRPLALIEAKKTTKDVAEGRQQAKLYADALQKKYGRRPVIFLSNGIETRIIDGEYPERNVADIFSKRDLQKLFNLRSLKQDLIPSHPDEKIAGRYYQKAAISAICQLLQQRKRKALLVMATGSGKTRTAAALIDFLMKKNWVTNVLFLADRSMLVSQAKEAILNNLPNVSVTDLTQSKDQFNARVVVSTYQTMINCIDDVKDEKGRIFTPGHFDLIICDEVHRSIYNKYGDIFTYFDAPIIGLTATPKDEVDRNTYKLFELPNGDPTFAYSLEEGVKDGFLVNYEVVDTGTKFLEEGITYDDLSDEEKEDYEERFEDEDGVLPYHIDAQKLNKFLFNKDTIRKMFGVLMQYGLKVDYGNKLGKTIIFAQNHRHAEAILKVFHEEYPYLGDDFAQVIDYQTAYDPEVMKRQFANPDSMPQIAISVDMLDTGVDVPSILNLVFFKTVRSKTKFWQMVGRGTRLCEKLIDGKDKEKFLIFDFLGNYQFFTSGKKLADPVGSIPIQGAIFTTLFEMIYKLQEPEYQDEDLKKYRAELIDLLSGQVNKLNRNAFNVVQHLKYVDRYAHPEGYKKLTYEDVKKVRKELAHLIQPIKDDIDAIRFDSLMYRMERELLYSRTSTAVLLDLKAKATSLKRDCMDIPEVKARQALILKCLDDEYLKSLGIRDMEAIRKELRSLMKYIPKIEAQYYTTDYRDTLKDPVFSDPVEPSMDLRTYRERAESYIRQHEDLEAIHKLKNNEPLTEADIRQLEEVLWGEVGSKADYEAEMADKPLGAFVRSVTGLDPKAAKEAFAVYLDEAGLNPDQINFVNQIINYLTLNGTMDKRVMMESPFNDRGSLSDLFGDRLDDWMRISHTIDEINRRALH